MAKFVKMQGIGNDFVILNFEDVKQYNLKIFSKFMCDRHFGVGADGVVLFSKSRVADFRMRIFNNDGSEAEMCGNGIRCLAKFLYEKGYIDKERIIVETLAGRKEVDYVVENKKIMAVRVKMGRPIMDINRLPVYVPRNYRYKEKKCKLLFTLQDGELLGIFLTVGNPHTVIEVNDLRNFMVAKFGKIVENYKYFPQKTNVEFVQVVDDHNIRARVWERGVGETLACGTGAVASAFAMYKEGKVKNKVCVELDGGKINIEINPETEETWMEGPAVEVFDGEIDL